MIFTVEARPLPGGQWLLSVLEVPSVTLVVDDIEASAQRVRAEIGGTLVLDVDDDEMRFLANADAPDEAPTMTPLSPFGQRWRSSEDENDQPHRITGRRMLEITDDPPMRPTAVPDIPQVA
ncbi:hypothetical protein [Demequina gelatinilytica]|uniref:hypothetical protein n=1 Tax=Demequina gelatinilytica TaxID=1638980 RepID=UPI000780BF85|nr:hypothetical protein [Demequina gelatinilytica]